MGKKILFISSFPSHPQVRGKRVTFLSLASSLRHLGHDINFLFLRRQDEPGDEAQMRRFWKEQYYSVEYRYPKRTFLRRIVQVLKYVLNLNLYFLDNWFYSIDDWYDDSIDQYIRDLEHRLGFDVIVVEHVFFSKALTLFDRNVLKVINTHDLFMNRHKIYQQNKRYVGPYKWFTATPQEEVKGLNRADVIIANQDEEERILQQITQKKVITVGHLFETHPPALPSEPNYEILFVGSCNVDNIIAMRFFLKDVFDRIQSRYPETRLLLAGEICDYIEDFRGCIKLGIVDNLQETYRRVDLVINPVRTGTGLPVKSIEALSYSKPLVTTPLGARGLANGTVESFLIGETPEAFAEQVIRVFENAELRSTLSENAYFFANQYNEKNLANLASVI